MDIPVAATTLNAGTQSGQTFFVAPNGDDDNDGSIERPFATITHAIEAGRDNGMEGGDRIFLRAGTYYPATTLTLLEHGNPQRWSQLAAWQDEHVVLDGSRIAPGQRPTGAIDLS